MIGIILPNLLKHNTIMRHFMMDVWIWTEDKHSKPLKTIRFEQDHFPTDKECWHWFTKDEDVEIYMKSDICVKFNNVHEYHK
jgi:hypothetical protein